MSLIYALIGAVAGGMLDRFPGVIFGACAGWLLGNLAELQERFSSLERRSPGCGSVSPDKPRKPTHPRHKQ